MNAYRLICIACLALVAAPVLAQIDLPGRVLPQSGPLLDPVTGRALAQLEGLEETLARKNQELARLRVDRLEKLVRRNRDTVEFDANGEPARRGVLLLLDPTGRELEIAAASGFGISGDETIEVLGMRVIRLSFPAGQTLSRAERRLRDVLPEANITADHLHFASGAAQSRDKVTSRKASTSIRTPVGIIDGAPGAKLAVRSVKGFAAGAPHPSNHGSAVVFLLKGAGVDTVHVADVYGTDKAGGNALAIARAIGWLTSQGSRVINISLVGPRNALVEQAARKAQMRGVVIVASVGNDGPAAPPSYPASYRDVIAVSGVDSRNRVLLEAGRSLHLDYVAPGADIFGSNAKGERVKLRGTSFASPLAAARLAAALESGIAWRSTLDAEARDLGKKGPDPVYGRGLLCGTCRPRK